MMTDTVMPLESAQLPQDAMEMPHMSADTFSLPVVSRTISAPQTFTSIDRAALLAALYGPHGGLAGRVERINRTHRRRRDALIVAEARAQREGVRDVA